MKEILCDTCRCYREQVFESGRLDMFCGILNIRTGSGKLTEKAVECPWHDTKNPEVAPFNPSGYKTHVAMGTKTYAELTSFEKIKGAFFIAAISAVGIIGIIGVSQ